MATKRIFNLNDEYALGYNELQWMIMRKTKVILANGEHDYNPISFHRSKSSLLATLPEKGIRPTRFAREELNALPEDFADYIDSVALAVC